MKNSRTSTGSNSTHSHWMVLLGVASLTLSAPSAQAVDTPSIHDTEIQRNQSRDESLRKELEPRPEAHLPSPTTSSTSLTLDLHKTACFPIQEVRLEGDSADRFQFALREAINRLGFKPGMCLGSRSVNAMMTAIQDAVIAAGYSTTRIVAGVQNLRSSQKVVLTVIPGRIHAIRFNTEHAEETHVGRIMAWGNQFPCRAGDILNLRELEVGLENYKRNSTVNVDFAIEPAETANESDVVVSSSQRLVPYRLILNADNFGSRQTGKYQAGVTFAGENMLGLSDLLYVSTGRELGRKRSFRDETGHKTSSGTRNFSVHYSVPFGRWTYGITHSQFRYH